MIVRSREGGFISRNCLKCGKPELINDRQLPSLRCEGCGHELTVETIDRNYHYSCATCSKVWKVADQVPHWSDVFPYWGLPAGR
jgi:DNA-directed RNA polymerase subunit RPC12/RpoP